MYLLLVECQPVGHRGRRVEALLLPPLELAHYVAAPRGELALCVVVGAVQLVDAFAYLDKVLRKGAELLIELFG